MKWTNSFKDNLPKLTQEEVDHLNRPTAIEEVESIINNLVKQKAPCPDVFTGGFYPTFKEQIIPILCNLFQKIEANKILLNSFYEASITLISKPVKDSTRKGNYRPTMDHERRCKNSQQIESNDVQKELCTMTKWDLSLVGKDGSTFENQLM